MENEQDKHKILNSYKNNDTSQLEAVLTVGGLVSLIYGIFAGKTAATVGGAGAVFIASFDEALEYTKAYFSAKLDYMKNGKFTKLDE